MSTENGASVAGLVDVLEVLHDLAPKPTPVVLLNAFARFHAQCRDLSDAMWAEWDLRRIAPLLAERHPTGTGWPSPSGDEATS